MQQYSFEELPLYVTPQAFEEFYLQREGEAEEVNESTSYEQAEQEEDKFLKKSGRPFMRKDLKRTEIS